MTLGKYLSEAHIPVTGFYSRTKESAAWAAAFTKTAVFDGLKELITASDTLFITTPDGVIADVWDCIAAMDMDLSGYKICHFSGSLSSNVFSGIERTKACGCSIHPMYAFSDKETSWLQFQKAYLTMEGSEKVVAVMRSLFEGLGHTVYGLDSADKVKYHAAAVLASNAVVGLFYSAQQLLSECGFAEEESRKLLAPLITENVSSIVKNGCAKALTGPVERADVQTVKNHLAALQGSDEEAVYRSISKKLTALAKCRNPQRDYTALERIMDEKYSTDL